MKKLFVAILTASMLIPSLALADDFTSLNTAPAVTPQVYGFMDNKFYDVSGTLKYFGFMDGTLFDINGNGISRAAVGLPPMPTVTPANTQLANSPTAVLSTGVFPKADATATAVTNWRYYDCKVSVKTGAISLGMANDTGWEIGTICYGEIAISPDLAMKWEKDNTLGSQENQQYILSHQSMMNDYLKTNVSGSLFSK